MKVGIENVVPLPQLFLAPKIIPEWKRQLRIFDFIDLFINGTFYYYQILSIHTENSSIEIDSFNSYVPLQSRRIAPAFSLSQGNKLNNGLYFPLNLEYLTYDKKTNESILQCNEPIAKIYKRIVGDIFPILLSLTGRVLDYTTKSTDICKI